MSILGAYEALVYTSSGVDKDTGNATNVGVMTRINPILDPGNIEIAGTGARGLYDVLLGMREVQFSADMLFTDESFLTTYQDGLTAIPWLHLRFATSALGLTFENAYINRITVEARHNQAISASIEFWAEDVSALGTPTWLAAVTTPYRWSDSTLSIGLVLQTTWWSWRYEIVNNLQRLGNVDDGDTRSIRARHRRVTGLIIIDLTAFTDYTALVNYAAEPAKFNITIDCNSVDLINNNCRWGRLEAPGGPEDLIARRFPFVALDIS